MKGFWRICWTSLAPVQSEPVSGSRMRGFWWICWMVSLCGADSLLLSALMGNSSLGAEEAKAGKTSWTIFLANDNCPDYTWGLTETQTRQAFADIVRAHLDEMTRTDHQAPENQNRYNAAVTQEVLCFVEKYPQRRQELIQRIREGRLYVSPYLCNSLWAFQDVEGLLRTFYPARRLERDWALPKIDCAHHIELPSLPWGHATLLAGCGIKYLTLPYLAYDSTFNSLKVPPVFYHEGPDGSRVMVWLDVHLSSRAGYTQAAQLLQSLDRLAEQWLAHYARLGAAYPVRLLLASGTHGDISPQSWKQARQFAEAIIRYNARPDRKAKLLNATFPMFWQQIQQQQDKTPWLPTIRGDFGHSWDLWPVSLAKYAAQMRSGQRQILAAEALLSIAALSNPRISEQSLSDRRRAEWCWAMLSDHAWNGSNPENQRHNAQLRRQWAEELSQRADKLTRLAWEALGAKKSTAKLLLFNPLSVPRKALVCLEVDDSENIQLLYHDRPLPVQIVPGRDGKNRLCFVSPEIAGFGLCQLQCRRLPTSGAQKSLDQFGLVSLQASGRDNSNQISISQISPTDSAPLDSGSRQANLVHATPEKLEGPFYRAMVDRKTGGLASLFHKPTGKELLPPTKENQPHRSLCQSVYFDGQEHTLQDVAVQVISTGPVLARLRIAGRLAEIKLATYVTLYAELDQVDFELQVHKPLTTKENRFCQVFPLLGEGANLRVATTGAVIRPFTQPQGDLVPGADTRRFAVQEYVDCFTDSLAVTLALVDAFVLRTDLEPITIESIGNDQNYREVTKDQDEQTEFTIRYSLQARSGGYDGAAAMAFARSAATPLCYFWGQLSEAAQPEGAWGKEMSFGLPERLRLPPVQVDPRRAVATCLKPADDPKAGGIILRIWETAGHSGPIELPIVGFQKAIPTDLLERDQQPVPVQNGRIRLPLRAHGFTAVRLLP
ncbi:MAG: hypothetical protein NZ602_06805 [Thermoguttaceae bacterium]|nr:hypothetical protein [Thermoguttaceae bacterium]MDW8038287.1 hypothetical protein [Thermoguttaceae bacterium]